MTEYAAVRNPDRCPSHPGAVLDDLFPDLGRSKKDVADLLQISRQHLYDIMSERKPVSPGIAVRLAKAFGGSAESWLRLQAAYDAWHAEREVDVSGIPVLRAA